MKWMAVLLASLMVALAGCGESEAEKESQRERERLIASSRARHEEWKKAQKERDEQERMKDYRKHVTRESYLKIYLGMPREEVEVLLGGPPNTKVLNMEVWTSHLPEELERGIYLRFENGVVVQKLASRLD